MQEHNTGKHNVSVIGAAAGRLIWLSTGQTGTYGPDYESPCAGTPFVAQ